MRDVLLEIDGHGRWSRVSEGVTCDQARARGAEIVAGPLLPGVIDAHATLFNVPSPDSPSAARTSTMTLELARPHVSRVALSVSPDALRAIATQLYIELLRGGYTHVCEFHYLHHDVDGAHYEDPLLMAWTLADAAAAAGIGLTLLPVLYERAGFAAPTLRHDQRRFATSADWVVDAQRRLADNAGHSIGGGPPLNAGVAIHSLRAASAVHRAAGRAPRGRSTFTSQSRWPRWKNACR